MSVRSSGRKARPAKEVTGGRLGSAEMAFFVLASYTGLGLFAFPLETVSHAGSAWPLAAVAALALTFGVAYGVAVVGDRHPGVPFSDLLISVGGPYLRWAVAIPWAVLDLTLAAVATAALCHVVVSSFLPATPFSVVLAAFIPVVAYTASQGIEGMTRAFAVVLLVSLGFLAVVSAFTASHIQYPAALVPHLTGLGPWLSGVLSSLYAVSGISAVFHLSAHARPGERRVTRQAVLAGVSLVIASRLAQAVFTVGTLGLTAITAYTWPSMSVIRLVSSHGFFFNRLGLLAVILSTASVWAYVACRIFSAGALLVPVGWRVKGNRASSPGFSMALAAAVGLFAYALEPPGSEPMVVGQVVNPGLLVLGVLFPVVWWLIDEVRTRQLIRPNERR